MSNLLFVNQQTGELETPETLPALPPDTRRWPTRTMFNHPYLPQDNELNNQPSQTVQDHNMSLKELVERSMRGQPIYGSIPINFGEVHMPNFQAMDISEREQFKALMREQVKDLRQKVEEQKKIQSQQLPTTTPPTEKKQDTQKPDVTP